MLKKILSLVLACVMLMGMSTSVFAENTQNTDTKKLSDSTVEWLDWFNKLSQEEQLAVNYRPQEIAAFQSQDAITAEAADVLSAFTSNVMLKPDVFALEDKMPTGGYELPYNPTYWDKMVNYANCYAYAMNVVSKQEYHKLQPGEVSGKIFEALTCSSIFDAAKADGPYLGGGRSIRESSYSEVPGTNEYKVALVIAPDRDYHWYRQDKDGGWSHKRGLTNIDYKDASGKYIYDPQTCNRDYGSGLNYSTWCGYYIVKY